MNLEALLAGLHTKLAQEFLDRLESGEATTSDLNVIRQFLKDNGIDVSSQVKSPIFKLSEALPFVSEDEVPSREAL